MAKAQNDYIPPLSKRSINDGSATYACEYSDKTFDKTFSGKPRSGAFGDVAPNGEGAPDVGYVDDGRGQRFKGPRS